MAVKRNVTVAVEPALLKRARAIAARRALSISALLADELRILIEDEARYDSARRRATALLDEGLPLTSARIDFWDGLIVAAAEESGAERIYSEDLSNGQRIAGVRIENPFL